jgi:hypothetical protein
LDDPCILPLLREAFLVEDGRIEFLDFILVVSLPVGFVLLLLSVPMIVALVKSVWEDGPRSV